MVESRINMVNGDFWHFHVGFYWELDTVHLGTLELNTMECFEAYDPAALMSILRHLRR